MAFLARVKMIIAIHQESDIEGQKALFLGDHTRHDNSPPKIRCVRPFAFCRLAPLSGRLPPLCLPLSRVESRRQGKICSLQPFPDGGSAFQEQRIKRYMRRSGVTGCLTGGVRQPSLPHGVIEIG